MRQNGYINARNTQGQLKAVLRQSTSPTVPLVPFVCKLELLRSFSEKERNGQV